MIKWLTNHLVRGYVQATKFITTGGTSSDFVKGDGSLDDNTYVLDSDLQNHGLQEVADIGNLYDGRLLSKQGFGNDRGFTSLYKIEEGSGSNNCLLIETDIHKSNPTSYQFTFNVLSRHTTNSDVINFGGYSHNNSTNSRIISNSLNGTASTIETYHDVNGYLCILLRVSTERLTFNVDFYNKLNNNITSHSWHTDYVIPANAENVEINDVKTIATEDTNSLDNYLKNTTDTLDGDLTVTGQVTADGGNSNQWNDAYTYSQVGHLPLSGGQMDSNTNILFGYQSLNGSSIFSTHRANNNEGYGIWMAYNLNYDGTDFIQPRGSLSTKAITVNHHKGGFSFLTASANGTNGETISLNEVVRINSVGRIITDSHGNSAQWNTAYEWGNHASAGYATESWVSSNFDNYQSWNLKTDGVQRTTIQSGETLDLVPGNNTTIQYGAGGQVTINSSFSDTTYTAGTGLDLTGTEFSFDTSWGDGRYLQSFTETDPIFQASPAAGITNTDITNWDAKGVQLTADQPNANIHLKDSAGNIISTLNVGFLNNEGTTISFNSTTDEIELRNDEGVLLSSFPASSLMTGVGFGLNLTGSTLELTDSANNTIDSVTLTISNIQGLQTALDGKVPTGRTITAGAGLTGGGSLAGNRTLSIDSSTMSKIDTAYGWGDHSQEGYALDSNVIHKTGNETKTGKLTINNDFEVSGISNQGGIYDRENGAIRIINPKGASYSGSGTALTGAIKITLPLLYLNTMLRFRVDVYNYKTNSSFSVMLGGYNYSVTSKWVQTFAQVLNSENKDYTIRFGDDGDNSCVWIGELDSNWRYLKVSVSNFTGGQSNANKSWAENWNISLVTTFDNVTTTSNNNYLYADWNKLKDKPTDLLHTADLNGYATETYVNTQVAGIVDSAPGTLDTLNELAAALGDDPNFATTVSNQIGLKADKSTTISAGTGLSGGGTLETDRTLSVKFGTSSGTVARGNDSRFHTHSNKSVLDGISSSDVSKWNGKQDKLTAGDGIAISGNNVISSTVESLFEIPNPTETAKSIKSKISGDVLGRGQIVIGREASAVAGNASNGIALGTSSKISTSAYGAVAIGALSEANHGSSIALGANTKTFRNNEVSLSEYNSQSQADNKYLSGVKNPQHSYDAANKDYVDQQDINIVQTPTATLNINIREYKSSYIDVTRDFTINLTGLPDAGKTIVHNITLNYKGTQRNIQLPSGSSTNLFGDVLGADPTKNYLVTIETLNVATSPLNNSVIVYNIMVSESVQKTTNGQIRG